MSQTRSITSAAAPENDGRLVTIGPLVLFSTETAMRGSSTPPITSPSRLARGGDPEDVYFEESDTNFAIGWKGNYQIRLAQPG